MASALGSRRAVALVAAAALGSACAPDSGGRTAPLGGSSGSGGTGGSSGSGSGGLYEGGLLDVTEQDSALNEDAACLSTPSKATLVPANILFVIDKSGSMNCNPPPLQSSAQCEASSIPADATQATKWQATRDALKAAIAAMPSTSSVGVMYFPKGALCTEAAPPADVAVASLTSGQHTKLEQSLDAVAPAGKTPLYGSLYNGYVYLDSLTLTGNPFVILISDGANSCAGGSDAAALTAKVSEQAAAGVRTFVIGVPGSEAARAVLSDISFRGQTAASTTCSHAGSDPTIGDCHLDMTTSPDFAQALNQALEQISGSTLSCEFPVPDKTPDGEIIEPGKVNVRYTPGNGDPPETIKQDPRPDGGKPCDGADGWQYSADGSKILLCGTSCDRVKSDLSAEIVILFGCKTEVR